MTIFGSVSPEVRNALDDWMLRSALVVALARDSVAVDVGAHAGDVLRDILRIAPHGHHVAFEPLPSMAATLRSSFPATDVRELALSDRTGTSSFVHVVDDPAYSGLQERTYPAGSSQVLERVRVKLARLDDEIGDLDPDFIKIDVEGGELQVLRGAVETLARCRPVLWFEHGAGAADCYGTTPGEIWDLVTGVGLDQIYDANAVGPLSRGAFEESFARGEVWNYLARSGEAPAPRSASAFRPAKAGAVRAGRGEPCSCGPRTAPSNSPPESLLDLGRLRGFVTLIDVTELAEHCEQASGYFRAFGPNDDATLLVYAAAVDLAWAQSAVHRALAAGGTDPAACADVRLCIVDDSPRTLDRIARRVHAVITAGAGSWLPVRRPTYGWEGFGALRRHAERSWGEREGCAPYSYEAAIAYVVERGWTTEFHARDGSVPETSMQRVAAALDVHMPALLPPRLLHIGNFLGISLSHLLNWARPREGVVVSVDPDIPHREVQRPQRAVNDLLAHFGLTEHHLLMCGYSLEKCFSNDNVVFDTYDPASSWTQEAAPENVLLELVNNGMTFDAALIDGNHDPSYLRRELAVITQMLTPDGLLVLDDVTEWWEGIRDVFEEVADGEWPFEPVDTDGRIAILRRL